MTDTESKVKCLKCTRFTHDWDWAAPHPYRAGFCAAKRKDVRGNVPRKCNHYAEEGGADEA